MLPGTLYPKDAEVFWSIHEPEATPAFEEVRPLFDEELRRLESEGEFDVETLEKSWRYIHSIGVRLAPAEGGDEIRMFALHVYRDGEARMRATSSRGCPPYSGGVAS